MCRWNVCCQITELSHVSIPVMLMPDDFKAYTKIKIDNHLFNKLVFNLLFINYSRYNVEGP